MGSAQSRVNKANLAAKTWQKIDSKLIRFFFCSLLFFVGAAHKLSAPVEEAGEGAGSSCQPQSVSASASAPLSIFVCVCLCVFAGLFSGQILAALFVGRRPRNERRFSATTSAKFA